MLLKIFPRILKRFLPFSRYLQELFYSSQTILFFLRILAFLLLLSSSKKKKKKACSKNKRLKSLKTNRKTSYQNNVSNFNHDYKQTAIAIDFMLLRLFHEVQNEYMYLISTCCSASDEKFIKEFLSNNNLKTFLQLNHKLSQMFPKFIKGSKRGFRKQTSSCAQGKS